MVQQQIYLITLIKDLELLILIRDLVLTQLKDQVILQLGDLIQHLVKDLVITIMKDQVILLLGDLDHLAKDIGSQQERNATMILTAIKV